MTKLFIGFIFFFSISTEAAKCVRVDNAGQDIQDIFKKLEALNQTFQGCFKNKIDQANVASACYRIKISYKMNGQPQKPQYSEPVLITNECPLKSEKTILWNIIKNAI